MNNYDTKSPVKHEIIYLSRTWNNRTSKSGIGNIIKQYMNIKNNKIYFKSTKTIKETHIAYN